MFRTLFAGVAAVALMTGAAYAQDSTSTYYNRTTTLSTPFGSSETTTTTTEQAPPPPAPMAEIPPPPPRSPIYGEQSADVGVPPPPPETPPDYDQVTTTRRIGPDGVETQRTDQYQKRQTFSDGDGELSARTTTRTQTNATTYGPAPIYSPNPVAVGPSPGIDLPPYQRRTTITTTTTGE